MSVGHGVCGVRGDGEGSLGDCGEGVSDDAEPDRTLISTIRRKELESRCDSAFGRTVSHYGFVRYEKCAREDLGSS